MGGNLSTQPFSRGSGRITLKNCLWEYFHTWKSPDFRLKVLRCAGSYSRVLLYMACFSHNLRDQPAYSNANALFYSPTTCDLHDLTQAEKREPLWKRVTLEMVLHDAIFLATFLATLEKEIDIPCKFQKTCYTLQFRVATCNGFNKLMQLFQNVEQSSNSLQPPKNLRDKLLQLKGQLKRRDKLTSIARFWSPENGFEGIFEKFVFVLEISAVKVEELCGTNSRFSSFSEKILSGDFCTWRHWWSLLWVGSWCSNRTKEFVSSEPGPQRVHFEDF